MTVQISQLRVTADFDPSAYTRGMAAKVAADQAGAASSKAVGEALARVDIAAEKTDTNLTKLSRRFIESYAPTRSFDSALKDLENSLAKGFGADRAAHLVEQMYGKFKLAADGTELFKRGLVMISPHVDALNAKIEAQNAAMERAAQVQRNLATAQNMQGGIASRLGIGRQAYDAAGSASVFQQQFAEEKKAIDALRAAQAGGNFQQSLNAAMGIGSQGKSARDSASVFSEAAKAADDYASRLAKIKSEAFPLEAAQKKHNDRLAEYLEILRNGDFTLKEFAQARRYSLNVLDQENKAISGMAVHKDKYAGGGGLARHEAVNLSRQIQDVFVSLSSGQNPMTVLIQQGTQIADIFASSESTVGGFMRSVMGWLTPARVAMGGFATAAIAAGVASYQFASSQHELANSLMGWGRGSGQTVASLNAIADAAARAGNITRREAREAAGIFAGTGRIDGGVMAGLTNSTRAYGLMTGQDTTAAANELAKAFIDPSRGAETLNEKLGFLNASTLQFIKNAQAAGDRAGAQKALFDALNPALAQSETRVDSLSKVWQSFWKMMSEGADTVGKKIVTMFTGGSLEERLKASVDRISKMQGSWNARNPQSQAAIAFEAQQQAYLQEDIRRRNYGATLGAADVSSNQYSLRGLGIINGLVSDIERLNKLRGNESILTEILGDPQKIAKLGMTYDQVNDALSRNRGMMEAEAQRITRDGQLQLQTINAYTLGQRVAVEAERARIEALRAGKGELLAAQEAENARNRVVAEANRQARDALRDAQMDSRLVGLNPFQRSLQQERNRQERERDTLTNMSGASVGVSQPTAGGLNASFATNLKAFMDAIGGISVGSGYRSFAEQAKLYAEKGPGWAAPPGHSNHNYGLAADLRFDSPERRAEAHRRAAEFGLRFPMAHEPWHIEPINARAMRGGSLGGSISVSSDIQKAGNTRVQSLIAEQQFEPINAANRSLEAQINALEMQRAAFGKSTAEIAKSNAEQQLYNQYIQNGIPITDEMRAKISAYGDAAAKQSENLRNFDFQQKQLADWKGFEQSTFVGFWNDFGQAIRNGESGLKALEKAGINALGKIADKLMSMAAESLWQNAFGGQSGGLFGMLIKGAFGGGSIGGLTGTGTGGLYANGGVFMGGNVVPFATGGVVGSPTYFPMRGGKTGLMGEAGPEAIMPLRRDSAGRLGIAASIGGGGVSIGDTLITINGNLDDQRFSELRAELDRRDARNRAAIQQVVATEPKRRRNFENRAA